MADITSVNGAGVCSGVSLTRPPRVETPALPAPPSDRLEISDVGRLLSSLGPDGTVPIRAAKVAEIREAITTGTYESDDKIDYVVSRLMTVLGLSPPSIED